jgi:hypothetical protein
MLTLDEIRPVPKVLLHDRLVSRVESSFTV